MRDRGLQVAGIAPDGRAIFVRDGADAGVSRRTLDAAREFFRHEVGESNAIAAEPDRRRENSNARFESRQPREDVVGPAGFSVFAVVDDVESGGGLLPHDLVHETRQRLFFLRGRQVDQRLRPHDTSNVRRQDAIDATLHALALDPLELAADVFDDVAGLEVIGQDVPGVGFDFEMAAEWRLLVHRQRLDKGVLGRLHGAEGP